MNREDQPALIQEIAPVQVRDAERERIREEYRARLAEKLKDPEFRKIEGFPIGTDEAILALSDPPYYTACPNPFLDEWIAEHAKPYDPDSDDYHREPYAADVSEGKKHPIYLAHSYHTKVPHRAIMRYILHYTEPGDVVYDGFCGTGMTGVAAQLCGDKAEVEALGYKVDANGNVWEKESLDAKRAIDSGNTNPYPHLTNPQPFSKLGARKAILNDLSPAATFIACNYNTPIDSKKFESEAKRILAEVEEECGWMYTTLHREKDKFSDSEWNRYVSQCAQGLRQCNTAEDAKSYLGSLNPSTLGTINYVVWSDVFICPSCSGEIVFWQAAVDILSGKVRDEFECPHDKAKVTKKKCTRKKVSLFDSALGKTISQAVQVPVLVNYAVGKIKGLEHEVNEFDVAMCELIEKLPIPDDIPKNELPDGVNTAQPIGSHGITHVHHFYSRRSQQAIVALRTATMKAPEDLKGYLWFFAEQVLQGMAKISRYVPTHFSQVNQFLSGTLYIGSQIVEVPPRYILDGKAKRLRSALYKSTSRAFVSTASATTSKLPQSTLDYVFTDPPFGGNLNYSELSFLWEAWLGVLTNNTEEAITSSVQKKGLMEYQSLMTECFRRYYEALKPGRWMTVEFHNSANAVWNSIQEGLEKVGFIVADVRVIDKEQYSFKQVTTSGATKKDLVISCYKPSERFAQKFQVHKGTPQGVREFVENHLEMLPVGATTKTGTLESLSERTLGVLFDRMIGYHLVRGARIPLSAAEFRQLLDDNFYQRDGMYFLPNQVVRYDALKSRGMEVEQLSIFVRDEKSAVQWIRNEIESVPQTLGELTIKFMQASQDWGAHEVLPELKDLLQQYFIREDDDYWTVPDPLNEKHLEEIRKKSMIKEFLEYLKRPGQLKSFRTEAVLTGFAYCWETKQYDVIVSMCEKISPKILQEIQELVMYYDIAKDRAPDIPKQIEFKWE